MKTNVQVLREQRGITQAELAEKAGLSIRTIQRVEAGQYPKGFTLKALANALETDTSSLLTASAAPATQKIDISRAKLINISSLLFIIPLGNVIFPAILTYKTNDQYTKNLGKQMISVQIIFTVITGTLMMISPFLQQYLTTKFGIAFTAIPLFLVFLILIKSLDIFVIIKNGMQLSKKSELFIKLKYSFL